MNDITYERAVDRLAQRWDRRIDEIAIAAVQHELNDPEANVDSAIDAAKDAVERVLFDSPEWERVEAVDISDIAYDAAHRGWSQVRAWDNN